MINEKRDRAEYMRKYRLKKSAKKINFNADLARTIYKRLLLRGISKDDAQWAVLDLANTGFFSS